MKANEFEQRFEDGEAVLEALDLSKACRVAQGQKRVNVDFPAWMVESLDSQPHPGEPTIHYQSSVGRTITNAGGG